MPCSSALPSEAEELVEFSKNGLEPVHVGMLCCWKEWVPLQSLEGKRFLSRDLRLCAATKGGKVSSLALRVTQLLFLWARYDVAISLSLENRHFASALLDRSGVF